jgi:peroxiredoxin
MMLPKVGEVAPLFTLPSQRGVPMSLSDALRRGPVTVAFVGRVTTAGRGTAADRRILALVHDFPRLHDAGIALFAIVSNHREQAKRCVEEIGTPFHLLCDDEGAVARQYGLSRWRFPLWRDMRPALFGIEPDGRIHSCLVGDWVKTNRDPHS